MYKGRAKEDDSLMALLKALNSCKEPILSQTINFSLGLQAESLNKRKFEVTQHLLETTVVWKDFLETSNQTIDFRPASVLRKRNFDSEAVGVPSSTFIKYEEVDDG